MNTWNKSKPIVEFKKKKTITLVQKTIPVQEIKTSTGKLRLKIRPKEELIPKKIDKKPYFKKEHKNNDIILLLKHWEKQYPKVFNLKKRIKPLKQGIAEDIFAASKELLDQLALEDQHKKAKALIKKALAYYCSNISYFKSAIKGNPRYDLQGNECGVVNEDQENWAKERLKDIEKRKNK